MISVVVRTLIMYIFVSLGIRLMGKRQIGDMQPGELVVTLLISDIATIPMQDLNQPLINGVVAIFVLVIVEIIISVLTMKSIGLKKLLNGRPVVIIKNGKISETAMRKVRLTGIDLIEMLRDKDVFDISTVSFAVIEVNGSLSVLLKPKHRPVTVMDAKIKSDPDGLQLPVITDGKVIEESIAALGMQWRDIEKLLGRECLKPKDLLLMTLDRYGNYSTVKKGEKI